MPEKSARDIKSYLQAVEEEQERIEMRERQIRFQHAEVAPAPAVQGHPPHEAAAAAAAELRDLARAPPHGEAAPAKAGTTITPSQGGEHQGVPVDWMPPLPSPPESTFVTRGPAAPVTEPTPLVEEDPFAEDLLAKTEAVLRKYSPAFISQNVETTALMLTFLQKTALLLPHDTPPAIRGKIAHNIESLRATFNESRQSLKKTEERSQLEGFMMELDKALRRYSRQQIARDPERAQYDYNVLLESRKTLPEGNPTFEMVVSKRMEEFERRIAAVLDEHKAEKELERFNARVKAFLKGTEAREPEALDEEYRQLEALLKSLEHRLDKAALATARNSLYRCTEKLEKVKSQMKAEIREKYHVDEGKRKEEYLGMRTFWRAYVKDLHLFTESVDAAAPSQYFSLYSKYQSLLETFFNLVRRDMVTKEESQQATQILEYVEGRLERLRTAI